MKQHGGAIVNMIADMWNGMPGMGHSGAARAGMLNFTETAALEWAPVRVNAVAPGWIASSGLDQYPPAMAEHIRSLPAKVPAGRLGTEFGNLRRDRASCCRPPPRSFPARASASTARCRTTSACGITRATARPQPFDGFHLATKPKVLE